MELLHSLLPQGFDGCDGLSRGQVSTTKHKAAHNIFPINDLLAAKRSWIFIYKYIFFYTQYA